MVNDLSSEHKNKDVDEGRRIVIRPAKPLDAPTVSRLMYYSDPKLALYLFAEPEGVVVRVLHDLFQVPNHVFSYTQAFVAEYNGKVVGSIFGFCGRRRKSLGFAMIYKIGFRWFKIVRFRRVPHMIRALIDFGRVYLPVSDEDYYLYFLAVMPRFRGQGIGRQLMKFAEFQARSRGLRRIVLDVEIDNKRARHLYERLGYRVSEVVTDLEFYRRSGIKGAIRMVKTINQRKK